MRVLDVMYNVVGDKVMPIITQLEVLVQEQSIMGNPQNYAKKQTIGGGNPPQPFAAQPFGQSNVGYQSTGGGGYGHGAYGQQQQQNPYGGGAGGHGGGNQNGAGGNGYDSMGAKQNDMGYGSSYGGNRAGGGGPTGKVGTQYGGATNYTPLQALNPYQQGWSVCVRVTTPIEVRTWHNAKGEGKVLGFDVVDAEGSEMKVVCFGDCALNLAEKMQQYGVYEISKATLTASRNPRYAIGAYEMKLDHNTVVQPLPENAQGAMKIPKVQYNFRNIKEIETLMKDTSIDVMGVVHEVSPISMQMLRTGGEKAKRSIKLRDDSSAEVELTLWGEHADGLGQKLETMLFENQHPILACKRACVGEFNGKNLSIRNNTVMDVNPDHPKAGQLRSWYDAGGKTEDVQVLSGGMGGAGAVGGRGDRFATIRQIENEAANGGCSNAFWVVCRGSITYIHNSDNGPMYPACPMDHDGRKCQKKMRQNEMNGMWECERHYDTVIPSVDWRYLCTVKLADYSGAVMASVFGEVGEKLFGMPAPDFKHLLDTDFHAFEKKRDDIRWREYKFKLKVNEDTYNDMTRVKYTIQSVEPICDGNFADESKVLIEKLKKLHNGESILEEKVDRPAGGGGGAPSVATNEWKSGQGGVAMGGNMGGGAGGYNQQSYGGDGGGGGGASGNCYKCGEPGHWASKCPNQQTTGGGGGYGGGSGYGGGGGGGGGGASGNCYKCGEPGHFANKCPNQGGGGGAGRDYGGGGGYGGGGYGGGGYGGGGGGGGYGGNY